MQNTATATRAKQKPPRQQAPTSPPQPRQPMTPDQLAALDVLFAAATPGLELAIGPAGTEVNLTARLKRAKRYGYGAPTAILFLDALPALDGLTRTEFRVLLRVLARARILIEDEAGKGTGRKFYRLNHALIWRGSAYGKHAAQAARPAPPIKIVR